MDAALEQLSQQVGAALLKCGYRLACAESCTGGWVCEVVTATAGSSLWFDCGFVTYSNAAKESMLGVRAETLAQSGAVSAAVVSEMAMGALARSQAQVALAISGVAGPATGTLGGSSDKPVGTVCFAWALAGEAKTETCCFDGDRESVRRKSVVHALQGLLALLQVRKR